MVHVWATVDEAGTVDERTIRSTRDQAIAAFLIEHRSTEPLHLAWSIWERQGYRCERFRLMPSPVSSTAAPIVKFDPSTPQMPPGHRSTGDAIRTA